MCNSWKQDAKQPLQVDDTHTAHNLCGPFMPPVDTPAVKEVFPNTGSNHKTQIG